MKKIFSICLLMVLGASVFAQETENDKKFHFGLKASPGLSWLKTDSKYFVSDGAKLSFSYGIMTEFNFTSNYAFVTGLEVNNVRGASRYSITAPDPFTLLATTYEYTNKFKIQYLQIPLFLKMKTKEIGMIKYFGQFGLGNNFRLKAKGDTTLKIGSGSSTTTEDNDLNKDINLIRESLLIGLGLEYNLSGSTSVVGSLTYDNGFSNLLQDKTLGKLYSKGVILNIGILF